MVLCTGNTQEEEVLVKVTSQGWICAKCKASVAPTERVCPVCVAVGPQPITPNPFRPYDPVVNPWSPRDPRKPYTPVCPPWDRTRAFLRYIYGGVVPDRTVTVTALTTFTIPVNVTVGRSLVTSLFGRYDGPEFEIDRGAGMRYTPGIPYT